MGSDEGSTASSSLPQDVIEAINDLDEGELRAVIDYARQRRWQIHSDITEQIEPSPGEEIVRIEEQPAYTEVVKKEPCGEDCADCPHGPYLYHVHEEQRPDGDSHLHWDYIGILQE